MIKQPKIAESAFVARDADIYGDVTIGENCSIWFNSVIRTEGPAIVMGDNTNLQDLSVVHTDPIGGVRIGNNVTIGHRAIIHGCTIGDNTLIGMGAIIMNGAKVGNNCLIGAGALVTEGMEIPDNCMAFGSPAKVRRELTAQEIAGLAMSASHYVEMGQMYKKENK